MHPSIIEHLNIQDSKIVSERQHVCSTEMEMHCNVKYILLVKNVSKNGLWSEMLVKVKFRKL